MVNYQKFFILVTLAFFANLAEISAGCDRDYFKINDSAGAKITEIVTTVAHTRVLSLWGKEKHLRQLGDEVDKEVAFLQFWFFVFSHPKLANDMRIIRKSSMKYNNFVSGGRTSILATYNKDKEGFLKMGHCFATYLNLDPEKTVLVLKEGLEALETSNTGLKPFFDYLIDQKSKS